MFYRVGVPLLIVFILGLIFLGFVLHRRLQERNLEHREALLKEENWKGHESCEFDHPFHGYKCQREDFHLQDHYRQTPGGFVQW